MSLNSPRELVTGEHTRWVLDEQSQQPKLGVCQIDQVAFARAQFAFGEVENTMVKGAGGETRGAALGWREGRFIAPNSA